MTSDQIRQLHGGRSYEPQCPIAAEIPSIYQRCDNERARQIDPHIQTCKECQELVIRLNAEVERNRPNPFVEVAKNFGVGFVALLLGSRLMRRL